jgi:hypothetical protein
LDSSGRKENEDESFAKVEEKDTLRRMGRRKRREKMKRTARKAGQRPNKWFGEKRRAGEG